MFLFNPSKSFQEIAACDEIIERDIAKILNDLYRALYFIDFELLHFIYNFTMFLQMTFCLVLWNYTWPERDAVELIRVLSYLTKDYATSLKDKMGLQQRLSWKKLERTWRNVSPLTGGTSALPCSFYPVATSCIELPFDVLGLHLWLVIKIGYVFLMSGKRGNTELSRQWCDDSMESLFRFPCRRLSIRRGKKLWGKSINMIFFLVCILV